MKRPESNPPGEVCIVLCTCPDSDTARQLSRGLVERKLAACVNIVADVTSVFHWQVEVQEETEVLMIIKTTYPRFAALESWLQANHPYDVPEILQVPVDGGLEKYLDWVKIESAGD